jgi:hypothetical protein
MSRVDWESELPPIEGLPSPPADRPQRVVERLVDLARDDEHVGKAAKMVLIVAYTTDDGDEVTVLYRHGASFTEQIGLLDYELTRLRGQVSP